MEYAKIVKDVKKLLKTYRMKLTLRQVYYRLVSAQTIPNTRTSYQQLSKVLVKARERADIDPKALEDRSRQVIGSGDYGYESPEDFITTQLERLRESGANYTRPLWTNQPLSVSLVLEKDALSRLFMSVANRYRVRLYATRGYGSFTYLQTLNEHLADDKPNTILYFGDYDPSGRDIERDLGARLRRYEAPVFSVVRKALTEAQINSYKLPHRPEDTETLAKLSRDTRAKRYGIDFAVELDALDPKALLDLIESGIIACLDLSAFREQLDLIDSEKVFLRKRLESAHVIIDGKVS
jgi:hypothetical protein